jgi:hypothetical protein
MQLPPELLDEIIGHLPPNDKQSLRRCSLVARSWIHPCQKRLFESVGIHNRNSRSWLDNISPTNVELLGHTRTLSYRTFNRLSRTTEPAHLPLCDYFPSFRQLRRLILSFAHISIAHSADRVILCFPVHTLGDLPVDVAAVTTSAFVALINYFPNLECLDLRFLDSCTAGRWNDLSPFSTSIQELHATVVQKSTDLSRAVQTGVAL